MVNICCVCKAEHSPESNIILHCLPKDPNIRQQWLKILKKDDIKYLYVCNKHFKSEDYRKLCDRSILKKGAIPQLHLEILNTSIQSSENNLINFEDPIAEVDCYTIKIINDNQNVASVSIVETATTKCLLGTTDKWNV
ncbi:uncharacterized protein LOC114254198 [Monomorium pharaonis]|uniref:uncharacterized protein LOC114254198 n=1 Tax=Monomorium pharaonis TaxID=307658 RepID=UPI001747CDAC|nr:uncharacterized protein LOC114254198 [Monomorium pharaonis]